MLLNTTKTAMQSDHIIGRQGFIGGYGLSDFGLTIYANPAKDTAVYQRRIAGYNQHTGKPPKGARKYFVAMRSSWHYDANSQRQQIAKTNFQSAVMAWKDLTIEQKANYNEAAASHKLTGWNYFIKLYLEVSNYGSSFWPASL